MSDPTKRVELTSAEFVLLLTHSVIAGIVTFVVIEVGLGRLVPETWSGVETGPAVAALWLFTYPYFSFRSRSRNIHYGPWRHLAGALTALVIGSAIGPFVNRLLTAT